MIVRPCLTAAAATLVVLLTGCAGAPTATPSQPAPTPTTEATVLPTNLTPLSPEPAPGSAGPGQLPTTVPDAAASDPAVERAVAAEAERSGVDTAAIEVTGYAVVTWSDSSLGCPEPGMMYGQALTPGKQLVLTVDGQQVSYHAGATGDFFYCAAPQAPSLMTAENPNA